jgi:hypothetical protein
MASNKRKKVFPKKPVQFHSKLEKELGKWSNKNGYEASVKGIYSTIVKKELPKSPVLDERQVKQLAKLKEILERENHDKINYKW